MAGTTHNPDQDRLTHQSITQQSDTFTDPFDSLSASSRRREELPAFERFQYTSQRTPSATVVSFTLPQEVSFYDAIRAANQNYTTHASKEQRRRMLNLLFDGVLHENSSFQTTPDRESRFEVHILSDGQKKSRKHQIHPSGKIAFDSRLVVVDTTILLTAATLHMEREILHGRTIHPQTGKGDLLNGCTVRTNTNAVELNIFGLMTAYVGKRERRKNLIVAGTPRSEVHLLEHLRQK